MIYSDDSGRTWHKGQGALGSECQTAEIRPGLLINTARASTDNTYIQWSTDNGITWSGGPNKDLRSPIEGVEASILVHPNGKIYHSAPDDVILRNKMVVKVSSDDGKTWQNQ